MGFREKNIPWHFRRQRQPSWPPGMPVTHQRSKSAKAASIDNPRKVFHAA